jgi:predicted solute-binding protein
MKLEIKTDWDIAKDKGYKYTGLPMVYKRWVSVESLKKFIQEDIATKEDYYLLHARIIQQLKEADKK